MRLIVICLALASMGSGQALHDASTRASETRPTGPDGVGPPVIFTVEGRMVDEKTGAPVDRARILITSRFATRPNISWMSKGEGTAGKYSVGVTGPGDTFFVRIEADGYLPFDSSGLDKSQVSKFEARLRRSEPIRGRILLPDGRPADMAEVALRESYAPQVVNGKFFLRRDEPSPHAFRTDASGQFILPGREGRVRVYAVHPSGWGEWVVDGQGPASEPLKMSQWCKVEGTLREKDKPLAGNKVRIVIYPRAQVGRREEYSARNLFRYEATTDAKGRFEFDRLIDGSGDVRVEMGPDGPTKRTVDGFVWVFDMKPGDHRIMTLGGSGVPVIGTLKLAPELRGKVEMPRYGSLARAKPQYLSPPGFENLPAEQKQDIMDAFYQTPVYQEFLRAPWSYGVRVKADGTFRAEDIPPGEYDLIFQVIGEVRRDTFNIVSPTASAQVHVRVPETAGAKDGELIDAGVVTLWPREMPRAGPK